MQYIDSNKRENIPNIILLNRKTDTEKEDKGKENESCGKNDGELGNIKYMKTNSTIHLEIEYLKFVYLIILRSPLRFRNIPTVTFPTDGTMTLIE